MRERLGRGWLRWRTGRDRLTVAPTDGCRTRMWDMSLVTTGALVEHAASHSYVVPSFNVFNMESIYGAVAAAESARSPVVLAVAESHLRFTDLNDVAAVGRRQAVCSEVPIALHLDHGQSLTTVTEALKAGFTSVMFDGFGLPLKERVRQTRSVVDMAHSVGVSVEAEFGHITKQGVDADQRDQMLIDPEQASDFATATGIDILAAAAGSVHGQRAGEAVIDFNRLADLSARLGCALSLHGGSGLSAEQVGQLAGHGVSKVSYFTGLSSAAVAGMRSALESDGDVRLTELMAVAQRSFAERAKERIRAFGSAGRGAGWVPAAGADPVHRP
jgi:fructose-bisphosphate aldolase, class II